ERYRTEARDLKNVFFTGRLSRPAVGALLKASRIGIAPYLDIRNFRDNVPNKIVEYLSVGLPILSPLSGEVGQLLSGGAVGLHYAPGSAPALAGAMNHLAGDGELRRRFSSNARQIFMERYEAVGVHSRLTAYLEQLAGRHTDTGFAA